MGEVSDVGEVAIRVATDIPTPHDQRKEKGVLGRCGVAAGEREVLLKIGRFDVDRHHIHSFQKTLQEALQRKENTAIRFKECYSDVFM